MKGVKTVYTITEAEMIQNLCIIKRTLDEVKQKIENITFMNNEVFFTFLNELNCPNGETISQILNKLEHCIPFALTDESFALFMSSCNSILRKWKISEKILYKVVKMIFCYFCIRYLIKNNGTILYKIVKHFEKKIVLF